MRSALCARRRLYWIYLCIKYEYESQEGAPLPDPAAERQHVLALIREHADPQTGRALSRRAFTGQTGYTYSQLKRLCPSYNAAVREAGLVPWHDPAPIDLETMLGTFGNVMRQLGRVPTVFEFELYGLSRQPIRRAFGGHRGLAQAFSAWSADKPEWDDMRPLLRVDHSVPPPGSSYSEPLAYRWLRHAPSTELGVVLLFGLLAPQLGFAVETVQSAFPDCLALRQVAPGDWRRVRIEFEFESRNFAQHGHDPSGCDVIVCWRHNWAACPAQLEVLELQAAIGERERVAAHGSFNPAAGVRG